MDTLFITTKENTDKLIAMLYTDIPHYQVQKEKDGILINFGDLGDTGSFNTKPLEVFSNTFLKWFKKYVFIKTGDRFFEDSTHEEKWNIWKNDFRFVETYIDSMFERILAKRLNEDLFQLEYYTSLELDLESLVNYLYDLVELRMELIEEHFTSNIHEDFIELIYEHQQTKNAKIGII